MNPVSHFEIPMDNPNRAKKFYSEIFGWEITSVPVDGMTYDMATTIEKDEQNLPKKPGAINGGLVPREATSPSVILTMEVPSIETYLQKIKAMGGTEVTPKVAVGDMGFYARFKDSEGNVMGLWENK